MFEKRKYERFPFKKELTISASSSLANRQVEFYATSINISEGGILLYTIAQFKEQTACLVRFKSNKFATIERKGTILREVKGEPAEGMRENDHMYALEFAQAFTKEQLMNILERVGG